MQPCSGICQVVRMQMKAIPLLVLIKAIKDVRHGNTEQHRCNLDRVRAVCNAIYSEGPSIRDDLVGSGGNLAYLEEPAKRTLDVVQNTSKD